MTDTRIASERDAVQSGALVTGLCFLVAVLEGIDIQSMGVAMPRLAAEFGLGPVEIGRALSASLVGLLIGAAIGGRLSDRLGRKTVLIVSTLFLGLFSLATTRAWDYNSLLATRFLTGLGMGGAFPMLIAIVAESVAPRIRSTAISMMYAGMPIGGMLAAAIATGLLDTHSWRTVFYVGGFGPLLVVPVLAILLPRGPIIGPNINAGANAVHTSTALKSSGAMHALFGDGRAAATGLLWASYFFTLMLVYLLLNWLPSLMVANGFTGGEATSLSIALNMGAAIGSVVLGTILDRFNRRVVVVSTYAAMFFSIAALGSFHTFGLVLTAAFFAGFFTIGGQLLLYALSPNYYPLSARGTGIGSAVSIGRFGAICGPLLVGELIRAGSSASAVLMISAPCVLAGGVAVFLLLFRPTAD